MQRIPAAIVIYGALGATVAMFGVLAYWEASNDDAGGTTTLRQPEVKHAAPAAEPSGGSPSPKGPPDEPAEEMNTETAPDRGAPSKPAPPDSTADPAALKRAARAHFRRGRYRAAARAYKQATEHAPSDAAAFAGLGGSLLALDRAPAAVAAYRQAVRLSPKKSGFHAALGRALYRSGHPERARSAYRRAAELNPGNRAATAALAQLDRHHRR